jgi:hypothetical protein
MSRYLDFVEDAHFNAAICSRRASGSTTLARELAMRGNFDTVFVLSSYLGTVEEYGGVKNLICIRKEKLNGVIKQLEEWTRFNKLSTKKVLLIVEDGNFEFLRKNTDVKRMVYNGRHMGLSCIILVERPRNLDPSLRVNMNKFFFNDRSRYPRFEFCVTEDGFCHRNNTHKFVNVHKIQRIRGLWRRMIHMKSLKVYFEQTMDLIDDIALSVLKYC